MNNLERIRGSWQRSTGREHPRTRRKFICRSVTGGPVGGSGTLVLPENPENALEESPAASATGLCTKLLGRRKNYLIPLVARRRKGASDRAPSRASFTRTIHYPVTIAITLHDLHATVPLSTSNRGYLLIVFHGTIATR